MVSKSSTADRLPESSGVEHHSCVEAVVALENILGRAPDHEGGWLEALRGELDELATALMAHFEEEMASDLYGSLAHRAPQCSARLEELMDEHDEILQRLDAVREEAGQLSDDAELYQLRELNAHAQMLAAIIRRHEAEENEMVMRAYWQEIGSGD